MVFCQVLWRKLKPPQVLSVFSRLYNFLRKWQRISVIQSLCSFTLTSFLFVCNLLFFFFFFQVKRTTLVDSRTSVTDVKFAPKHMGLMLATCSADGIVRIYEAPDVMNLSQWSLQHEISCKLSCSCISWNPSR